jgi:hypothetical protein
LPNQIQGVEEARDIVHKKADNDRSVADDTVDLFDSVVELRGYECRPNRSTRPRVTCLRPALKDQCTWKLELPLVEYCRGSGVSLASILAPQSGHEPAVPSAVGSMAKLSDVYPGLQLIKEVTVLRTS